MLNMEDDTCLPCSSSEICCIVQYNLLNIHVSIYTLLCSVNGRKEITCNTDILIIIYHYLKILVTNVFTIIINSVTIENEDVYLVPVMTSSSIKLLWKLKYRWLGHKSESSET